MKLTVIIPCLNAAKTIGVQLEALANQKWHELWEVIVADNGSRDESVAMARTYGGRVPGLRIIDASSRKGAPYAMNLAASVARGESLAFCDADDEVAPGWVAAMGNALSVNEFVASRFDFTRLNPPQVAALMAGHPQAEMKLLKLWYPPHSLFAGSCGLGVRKNLHDAVSGVDESFFVVYDADYCVRIQRAGAELSFIPDALVHIRCRHDVGASFSQVRLWGEYNTLLYKRYRSKPTHGLYRWKMHAKAWLNILRALPNLVNPRERLAWCTRLGWQVGILKGSIKHLVPPIPLP